MSVAVSCRWLPSPTPP